MIWENNVMRCLSLIICLIGLNKYACFNIKYILLTYSYSVGSFVNERSFLFEDNIDCRMSVISSKTQTLPIQCESATV